MKCFSLCRASILEKKPTDFTSGCLRSQQTIYFSVVDKI